MPIKLPKDTKLTQTGEKMNKKLLTLVSIFLVLSMFLAAC